MKNKYIWNIVCGMYKTEYTRNEVYELTMKYCEMETVLPAGITEPFIKILVETEENKRMEAFHTCYV